MGSVTASVNVKVNGNHSGDHESEGRQIVEVVVVWGGEGSCNSNPLGVLGSEDHCHDHQDRDCDNPAIQLHRGLEAGAFSPSSSFPFLPSLF
jgi:hypothetical protein